MMTARQMRICADRCLRRANWYFQRDEAVTAAFANFAQRLGACPDAAAAVRSHHDGMSYESLIVDLADRHADGLDVFNHPFAYAGAEQ